MQSAKNICYSVSRAFRRASCLVQHGFDSQLVRFYDDMMLATYNNCEISGPIKILHMPAPILRTRRDTNFLIHLCHGDLYASKQPTPMPSALEKPTLITLLSKELSRLKR